MVGKSERKRRVGMPRRRWKTKVSMHLKDTGRVASTGFICIQIGSSVGSCEDGNEP